MRLFLLFWALAAQATTFMERPFPDAVRDAPIVVRGRVGASYTNWVVGPDGGKRIFTFTELTVDEVFKGPSAAGKRSLVMRELGGEKDGMGMQVAGTAQFERGEDVVVFLNEPAPDGAYEVRGMMMGKYTLEREDGQEHLAGAGLMDRQGHGEHVVGEAHNDTPPEKKWTLDALRQLIRSQGLGLVPTPGPSKPAPLQALSPTPAPPVPRAAPSPTPAPQLQNSPPGEPADDPWSLVLLSIGITGTIGVLVLLLRKPK
jgi:hypothetical protein